MSSLCLLGLFAFVVGSLAAPVAEKPKNVLHSLTEETVRQLLNDPTAKTTQLTINRPTYAQLVERNLKTRSNALSQPGFGFDFLLSFPFTVGTPGEETYFLGLETGVNKVFVFDKDYDNDNHDPERPTYDPSASETSKPKKEPFSVLTAGYLAKGKSYVEQVRFFGSDPPLNQTIGSVTSFNYTSVYPHDGVFGMGWDPVKPKQSPGEDADPIINLAAAFEMEDVVYTAFIGESFAALLWGFTLDGEPIPLHSVDGVPALNVDSIKYDSYESHVKTSAILDTGYSTIDLPPALYRQVVKAVQPKYDDDTGLLLVDCGDKTVRPPKLTLTIGGTQYDIRQIHYVIDKDFPGEKCVLAVSQANSNIIRLGMPFIRTVAFSFNVDEKSAVLQPVARPPGVH